LYRPTVIDIGACRAVQSTWSSPTLTCHPRWHCWP